MAAAPPIPHLKKPWSEGPWQPERGKSLTVGGGRGRILRLAHPAGDLAVRPYRHGGLRRLLFPSIFAKSKRPANEFEIHNELFEAGLPTVEPVGWVERRAGLPWLRRYYYYTRFDEHAMTLPVFVSGPHSGRDSLAELMAEILVQLYRRGIVHRDLNLNNWLLNWSDVMLIDFDKSIRKRMPPKDFLTMAFARIARSGVKLSLQSYQFTFFRFLIVASRALDQDHRAILAAIPKRHTERRFYHRLSWWIFGGHRNDR